MERPLRLAPETWAALDRLARAEDVSVGALIRDAIERDLYRRSRAKKADRPDERLIAPLRALLAEDLAFARDWRDLQGRLGAKGYQLIEAGAGLALHRADGTKLCKASDLGYSHARLARRLGTAFPGHAHARALPGFGRPAPGLSPPR